MRSVIMFAAAFHLIAALPLTLPPIDLRTTWALNNTAVGETFFARRTDVFRSLLNQPPKAVQSEGSKLDPCPKVGLGQFWYPSLNANLRGALALADIRKGEELCVLPVQSLLTPHTAMNSSLKHLVQMLKGAPSNAGVGLLLSTHPATPPAAADPPRHLSTHAHAIRTVDSAPTRLTSRKRNFDWRTVMAMYLLREG